MSARAKMIQFVVEVDKLGYAITIPTALTASSTSTGKTKGPVTSGQDRFATTAAETRLPQIGWRYPRDPVAVAAFVANCALTLAHPGEHARDRLGRKLRPRVHRSRDPLAFGARFLPRDILASEKFILSDSVVAVLVVAKATHQLQSFDPCRTDALNHSSRCDTPILRQRGCERLRVSD
jgi:hypothetical protein